jgi:PAS domain S-box-containing protein
MITTGGISVELTGGTAGREPRPIRYGRGVDDARHSVIIIDDAAEVRGLVRSRLRLSGRFVVVGEGGDGHEAVELCRQLQPDLVLLDVSMPDMDGLEALQRVREVAPRTRVVMYTGFDEAGLTTRAGELGAAALIEKSTGIARLADQLEAILQGAPPPDLLPGGVTEELDQTILDDHLERFREVFEEAAIGMATMTLTGRVVRANKALAELLGYGVAELVALPYTVVAPTADAGNIGDALRRAQDGTGEVVHFEHDVQRTGGRVIAAAAPVRDGHARPLYLFLQCQDVGAQRRAEEELRQAEQRFRLLVEAVRDYAIFMLDPAGRVISWNAGAQRINGYSAQDIIGRHFRTFYPREVQSARHPEHELELALEHGRYEEEGWRMRKDGSRFWASVVITAVYDHEGRHVGFAKVTRDIDERRHMLMEAEEAARALARANTDLAAANTMLSEEAADQAQFLAVTAHELRTPIGVLAGSARLLADHLDQLTDEERAALADSMATSAERLQRLLRDLLTAARLEANAVRLDRQDVDLSAVLARTVVAARAANPQSTIDLDVPPGLRVIGEADRLAQAVDNLIVNAVRHGTSPVLVQARSGAAGVEVAVSDAGQGVPAELRERLFDRFVSGSPRSGTGLGLFIVRELARAHRGDAWYESSGAGRPRFVVRLPHPPDKKHAQPGDMP